MDSTWNDAEELRLSSRRAIIAEDNNERYPDQITFRSLLQDKSDAFYIQPMFLLYL
jgi:hypothetical protein